ncbi:MAG: DUF3253 domain-containing protein [Psychroserpens sp.]|uniref:DUF3253 domain-containing protein n=1 Tax=Psychroserpens sp. TaxID=2020870 RepID=UPI003C777857
MKASEYKDIEEKHLEFAKARGSEKTYCPSEVARTLFPNNWRDKMDALRLVADDLFNENKLIVSQYSKDLDTKPSKVKGHIRLRRGSNLED